MVRFLQGSLIFSNCRKISIRTILIHQKGSNELNFKRFSTPFSLRKLLSIYSYLSTSFPETSHAHEEVLREVLWSGHIEILFYPSPGAIGICVPFVCIIMWDHSNDYLEKEDPLCLPISSGSFKCWLKFLHFYPTALCWIWKPKSKFMENRVGLDNLRHIHFRIQGCLSISRRSAGCPRIGLFA